MGRDLGPGAVVGLFQAYHDPDELAGCGFLIGPDLVLTCAHVIGAHLGLQSPVPARAPTGPVKVHFGAMDEEVTGYVLEGGWFGNGKPSANRLSDIAVLRLDRRVESITMHPPIVQRLPAQTRPVLINGAENRYKEYGQQVFGTIGPYDLPNGRRQIDPKESARGFTIETGFSGSPVFDDVGCTVYGMISAVAQGTGVAYAITAEDLWQALREAGLEAHVRLPDATDQKAEAALRALSAEYEAKLAEGATETDQLRRELDQLRQGVRTLEQDAREKPLEGASAALQALTAGHRLPAAEILRRQMEEKLSLADDSRREAASLARQLGAMLKPVDCNGH